MNTFTFSGYDQSKYSEEENADFQRRYSEITEEFIAAMESGKSEDSLEVQAIVEKHYKFTCQFWVPNKDSYRSLAISYIIPSPARKNYESRKSGLSKFVHDAVNIYAERVLAEEISE